MFVIGLLLGVIGIEIFMLYGKLKKELEYRIKEVEERVITEEE